MSSSVSGTSTFNDSQINSLNDENATENVSSNTGIVLEDFIPQKEPKSEEADNQDKEEPGCSGNSFECNICLDTAKDAVVSLCGHLFCWPCLHRWLETQQLKTLCPVCKAVISKDKVVPLYGRGADHQKDPRDKVPPRPAGQRTEPPDNGGHGGGIGGMFNPGGIFSGNLFSEAGVNMSLGIGAFPFGLFAATFNIGGGNNQAQPNQPVPEEEQFMSKVFLWIGIFFIIWLWFA